MTLRRATKNEIAAMRLERGPQMRGASPEERVRAYCHEEVARQGHNVADAEGIDRIDWMLEAWRIARKRAEAGEPITVDVIEHIGKTIEPIANENGFRNGAVWIGGEIRDQDVGTIRRELYALCDALSNELEQVAPLEWYKRFEQIHPFFDGNGRTGKVLLTWLLGLWDDPLFPPADLFGHPIINP